MKKTILVIKLGALGDFIQSLGPMRAIRHAHPGDTIVLLTTAPFAKLASASGYVDRVLVDKRPKWHDLSGWISLRRLLNGLHCARVYDLQNNDRTQYYLRLFSPRPEWVGAARGASHRNDSKDRTKGRAFYGHVQTLAMAGIHSVSIDDLAWMTGSPDILSVAPRPYALIVPGSAPSHPEKRWPAQNYAALCRSLLEKKITPVLIGTAAEQETLREIEASATGTLNLCGKTSLFDIPALAHAAQFAVGNDTGPMHLIAPTGCKTLVLFSGHTNPEKHAPLGQHVVSLKVDDLEDLSVEKVWETLLAQQILE